MGGGKVVSWVLYGALAFLLALVNLALALLGKGRGQNGLLFGSLACGVLNMLEEYRMAVEWVQKEDWSALMDVLPAMEMVLTAAVFLGLGLNLAALVLHRVRRKEKTS